MQGFTCQGCGTIGFGELHYSKCTACHSRHITATELSVRCEVELEKSIEEQIEDAVETATEEQCEYCEHAGASYQLDELRSLCDDLPCKTGTIEHGKFIANLKKAHEHICDLANEIEDVLNCEPDNLERVQGLAYDLRTTLEDDCCDFEPDVDADTLYQFAEIFGRIAREL